MVCVAPGLDLCVAAAGISSSGGHPCNGLLPLLDPGLHYSCVQDECTDHGCHSSLGSWGCVCLHLLTEEGRGNLNICHKLGVMLFSAVFFAWFLYFTHSNMATRPGLCCAATMLWTGIITSTPLMGSMCLLLVSFTCVCLCVCECVHVSYIHPMLSLTLLSDLLPLVIIAMVVGYIDKDNKYASSDVKFAIAIGSIIPLSYYIGMGIARSVHLNKPFVDFKYISTVFILTKNVKRYKPFFMKCLWC